MNILTTNRKGGPYETIKDYMKKSLTNKDYELEWIYGSHPRNSLSKEEFLKILNFCRQNYKFKGELNDLDIRSQYVKLERSGLSNIRCTVSGVQNIKKYCKTNSIIDIPGTTFLKKVSNKDDKNPSLSFNQITNTDYNFRINLKKEILLDDDDDEVLKFKNDIKGASKYYRYKKRYSFTTSDNLFRIDITAVKSNTYNPKRRTYNLAKNLIDSRILIGKEVYELEIEYIGYVKINEKYPVEEYSKSVYSDWEDEKMSEEDYKAQMALINTVSEDISFTPGGSNYYLGDINDGYSFLSDYDAIDQGDQGDQGEQEVIAEPISTMNSPWQQAAVLKGNPMNLIYMNYWYPDKQWLFWYIKENNKELLFDSVLENHTEMDGPKNANYVKYTINPPIEEGDSIINEDHNKILQEKLESGFDGSFYVPFLVINGLNEGLIDDGNEGLSDESISAGAKKVPSWGPKSLNHLSKDTHHKN